MTKHLILGTLLLVSCQSGTYDTCYLNYGFRNYTNYKIQVTGSTELGILVDDPLNQLDLQKIDSIIQEVVQCTKDATFNRTPEELAANECFTDKTDISVKSCLTIKTAPDWHISSCTGEQVFSCNVGNTRCQEKGQNNPGCICSCRAAIQDSDVIVTTPNLKLLPAYLVTVLTGCLSPWSGRLAECSRPR